MHKIMIKYHPVKKEIHFLTDDNGSFNEVKYTDSPALEEYSPENGEFLLQDQGYSFFDNLQEAFLGLQNTEIVFKGTKIDYEDFQKMVANYNRHQEREGSEVKLNLGEFIELPDVGAIYDEIKSVAGDTVELFESELSEGSTKDIFRARKQKLDDKVTDIEQDNVNLCFVGTYSSGKSTFINAIIGAKILPEKIRPETAKMFRIKHAELPTVNFLVKTNNDAGSVASLLWSDDLNKFQFTTNINDGLKGQIDKVCQKNAGKPRHEQMRSLLNAINEMPNSPCEDGVCFVEGMIDVRYPMDIQSDINFTFYDTPGTDSNSSEHLRILKDALAQQTNSVLIVMYEPVKMDGKGNSVLYDLMLKSQADSSNEDGVTIDLSRSLHIVNQVDRYGTTELRDALSKPIRLSKNVQDVIDESEENEFEYDLQDKRVFYVSSKAAYCARAQKKGICDLDDEEFIEDSADKVIKRKYYRNNHMADAEFDTQEVIELSDAQFEQSGSDQVSDQLYIASGMYAVEREIIKYAEKYALAVKAKGLYDAVLYMMDGVEDECQVIEEAKRLEKEDLLALVAKLKTDMIADINQCTEDFKKDIKAKKPEIMPAEISLIQTKVTNASTKAERQINKLPRIVLKPEKIGEKNKAIMENLNDYIHEVDAFYLEKRATILQQQMKVLKKKIESKIAEYKEIDNSIISKILKIGDTTIPTSSISSIRMSDYINSEKALWIFTTTDKGKYKEEVFGEFLAITGRQHKAYLKEIDSVAQKKAEEMAQQFIENIFRVSETLEHTQEEAYQAVREQADALRCLNLAKEKIATLEERIWRGINE
ncbi:dynamin family protein [Oribacterium sp. WCC10]|uniref:dynamin family protein n=1 Tax=Oribacterium sp. WCC10 TaxID=1855343 RepID=UPI0008E1F21F|nr:dynamin family protein [Oribacterium sp. WCC10]SFG56197.1 Dynamin family protein [Oribacterium sp. WCC10]